VCLQKERGGRGLPFLDWKGKKGGCNITCRYLTGGCRGYLGTEKRRKRVGQVDVFSRIEKKRGGRGDRRALVINREGRERK